MYSTYYTAQKCKKMKYYASVSAYGPKTFTKKTALAQILHGAKPHYAGTYLVRFVGLLKKVRISFALKTAIE